MTQNNDNYCIMNVDIDFLNQKINLTGNSIITYDYNSTKIEFNFADDLEGTKIVKIRKQDSDTKEALFAQEIVNNEVILTNLVDVTTIHEEVTYTKYVDINQTIYWYNPINEKIYDENFEEQDDVPFDELTIVQQNTSIFQEEGIYILEVSLYGEDSKLTSLYSLFSVEPEQVSIGDEQATVYLPVFDSMINDLNEAITQVENLDISVEKPENVATVTITKKDGSTEEVEISDGEKGDTGNGINSISKTSTSGLIDTYTISYTNGSSTTYEVKNGKDGADGVDGDDYVITQQDYNAIAGVVETNIQPTLTAIESTANTANNTANTAKTIAEGANQSLSYGNYSTMITAFNSLPSTTYKVGQNVMIITLNVPDLWISSIENTSSTYTYTTDEAFLNTLNANGYVQVGYYKLSALETQKVDLTDYYTKTQTDSLVGAKYTKPNTGIPSTDMSTSVQTSLGKADTALQSEQYTGTITGITMNGSSKGTSGVVDLGTVITQHQDITGKVDKTSFTYDSTTETLTITIS